MSEKSKSISFLTDSEFNTLLLFDSFFQMRWGGGGLVLVAVPFVRIQNWYLSFYIIGYNFRNNWPIITNFEYNAKVHSSNTEL